MFTFDVRRCFGDGFLNQFVLNHCTKTTRGYATTFIHESYPSYFLILGRDGLLLLRNRIIGISLNLLGLCFGHESKLIENNCVLY